MPMACLRVTQRRFHLVLATTDVHAAVARHKAAWQAFEDNVWRADKMDPRYTSDTPENNAAIYDATSGHAPRRLSIG